MSERDTYLLRADKSDLDRWKNEARKRKIPFSQFCREALEAHAENRPKVSVHVHSVAGASAGGVEAARRHAQAREATERATGRPFRPDFKKGTNA